MKTLYCVALSGILAFKWNATGFEGDLTAYTLSSPSAGNCNFMTWPKAAFQKYAALNDAQWNDGLECGRCAEVSCAGSDCASTAREIVYIMDRCPECAFGDLDVSPSVFKAVTGYGPSRLKLQWKFVECPNAKNNFQICLKSGSNPYWAAIQPAFMPNGIKRMEINGRPATQLGSAYYFKVEDRNGLDLSRVRVSMSSATGQEYDQMVSLSAGNCIEAVARPSVRRPSISVMSVPPPTDSNFHVAPPPFELMHIKNVPDTEEVTNGSKKSAALSLASNHAQTSKGVLSTPAIAAVVGCIAAVCLIALTVYAVRKRPQSAQTPRHGGMVPLEAPAADLSTRGNYKSQIAIL